MKFEEFKLCESCKFCKRDKQYYKDFKHPDFIVHDDFFGDCCYCDKAGIGNCRFDTDYCRDSGCGGLHKREYRCCYCGGHASLDTQLLYENIDTSKDD